MKDEVGIFFLSAGSMLFWFIKVQIVFYNMAFYYLEYMLCQSEIYKDFLFSKLLNVTRMWDYLMKIKSTLGWDPTLFNIWCIFLFFLSYSLKYIYLTC